MNGGSSQLVAALRSLQICGTLCSCRATGRGWREANLIASHHPRRLASSEGICGSPAFVTPAFAENAKDGAPHCVGDGSEIKAWATLPAVFKGDELEQLPSEFRLVKDRRRKRVTGANVEAK